MVLWLPLQVAGGGLPAALLRGPAAAPPPGPELFSVHLLSTEPVSAPERLSCVCPRTEQPGLSHVLLGLRRQRLPAGTRGAAFGAGSSRELFRYVARAGGLLGQLCPHRQRQLRRCRSLYSGTLAPPAGFSTAVKPVGEPDSSFLSTVGHSCSVSPPNSSCPSSGELVCAAAPEVEL